MTPEVNQHPVVKKFDRMLKLAQKIKNSIEKESKGDERRQKTSVNVLRVANQRT